MLFVFNGPIKYFLMCPILFVYYHGLSLVFLSIWQCKTGTVLLRLFKLWANEKKLLFSYSFKSLLEALVCCNTSYPQQLANNVLPQNTSNTSLYHLSKTYKQCLLVKLTRYPKRRGAGSTEQKANKSFNQKGSQNR